MIAAALLALPWGLGWALAPHHHLNVTVVTILVTLTVPLATLWLTWAAFRIARRSALADRGAGSGSITAEAGSVVVGPGGTAIGQAVYQQPRGVTGKPVRLAPRPPFLAGREELLVELEARLTAGDSPTPQRVVLYGLGGVGKSSVAMEYGYRQLDAHQDPAEVGVAWEFAAEDPTVVAAGFAELAAQLGARDDADTRDPVASVHGTLAAFPARWLLIFDNVPDQRAVQQFLPPDGKGQVLITSRNPNWPPGQLLEVPVLGVEVAAGFLGARTGDRDEQAATELATELGGLPLALEQAGAYIQASGGSLADYLASFRQRRLEMLARGEPAGYDSTVAATWSLAFGELEQSAPQVAGLLRLLAFCAPEPVPLPLLLQTRRGLPKGLRRPVAKVLKRLEDPLAISDAIVALRRYSLVTMAGDGLVSVHRLVQAATADQIPPRLRKAWRAAAAALIEAAIPTDTNPRDSWLVCAALLPHAQAALTDDNAGMARIADYLASSGSYPAARDVQRRVLDAQEQALGPEHPDIVAARGNLARWTGLAGDPAAARDLSAELVPSFERVSGPEHRGTLAARADLAHWTGAAGHPGGARDQYAELLPVFERALGPEHPDTLGALANMANWTGQAGDPAAARDLSAELLALRERVSGPEHPDTLTTRHNLAEWTGHAGDPGAACDLFAELLPLRERALGPEHPDTLGARSSLARWTGAAGDPGGARDLFAELVPSFERVSGPEHPDTLDVRGNLAHWTGAAGDPGGARDLFAELVPVIERTLGPEHPKTLAARHGLAAWTGAAGDPGEARDLFAELVPSFERVSGPEHPDTLAARANLASFIGHAADAAGARDQYAALLPLRERVSGPEHPETLAARANLASFIGHAGDAAGARDQYAALLLIVERVHGAEHPVTLTVRGNLAYWTQEADRREN
jgi:hypothetical protein